MISYGVIGGAKEIPVEIKGDLASSPRHPVTDRLGSEVHKEGHTTTGPSVETWEIQNSLQKEPLPRRHMPFLMQFRFVFPCRKLMSANITRNDDFFQLIAFMMLGVVFGKGQMGSALMGSLQFSVCLSGTFWVLPLSHFYLPKSARA